MKKPTSTTIKSAQLYWHHASRYPKYLVGQLISIPISALVGQYLPPLVLANVINRLSKGQYTPHDVWGSFGGTLLLYAALMFAGTLLYRVVDAYNWRLEAGVLRDLGRRVYRHLLEQSANFHANSFGGSLVSQTSKILGAYIRIADTTVYQALPLFWGLFFTSIILAHRAPLFVVSLLLFSAAYIIVALFISKNTRVLNARHAAIESKQTGYLADSVTNVMAIKSFAGGDYENGEFDKVTDRTKNALLDTMRAVQRQMLYFSTLNGMVQTVALLMAVISVVAFNANLGTVFLILSYTISIGSQLFTFSNSALRNFNRAFGDAAEMTDILNTQPEIQDPARPEKLRIKDGAITMQDVIFTHDGKNNALFESLNLEIKPGERIGLVGHSGSGKSTMTRLLLRFSDLDGGAILIDGQNIANITQDDLHRSLAYVPQEPIMFHRSLEDNIRYGEFKASKEEVIKAARVAHAHDFIKDLPEGYATLVGERGVKLSGGQRQRIAIARAMLKNAPILLLDEATSALDSESEVLIQDALWKLMEGRTAIVIAHRLSTIQKMDRIVVLDEGKIVEQGTHSELLQTKGTYANLWKHQSGGFLED
jgi:ATP-binding cassette subfamily B protein